MTWLYKGYSSAFFFSLSSGSGHSCTIFGGKKWVLISQVHNKQWKWASNNSIKGIGCLNLLHKARASSYSSIDLLDMRFYDLQFYQFLISQICPMSKALIICGPWPPFCLVIYQEVNQYFINRQLGCENLINSFHFLFSKWWDESRKNDYQTEGKICCHFWTPDICFVVFLFEHIEAGSLVSGSFWVYFTAFILFPRAINETLSALMTTMTFLDHVIATLAHLLLSHALMDEFGYVNNLYIIWS